MIEEYFNLIKAPFRLSTDTDFYFDSARHRRALSYLRYGFQQAEGIVVVAGNAGVGKSMMIEQLLLELKDSEALAVTISPGPVSQEEILEHALAGFRIEASGQGKVAQIEALKEFLTDQFDEGRQVLLIVDEAQNLSLEALEEVRQLTNYNTNGQPLIQVFLVGQPALMKMLKLPEMEQLKQRVIASCELKPLSRDETREYVEHRMEVSGWGSPDSVFSDAVHKEIFDYTGGVPRKINTLCTRLLLQVALDRKDVVDSNVMTRVAADLGSEAIGQINTSDKSDAEMDAALTEEEQPEIPDSDNIVPFQQTEESLDLSVPQEDRAEMLESVARIEATSGAEVASGSGAPVLSAETAGVSSQTEQIMPEGINTEPAQEPESLEQLAEQITAEVEMVVHGQTLPEVKMPGEKLTGMKNEMQKLVSEVQEGLSSVEDNMATLRNRLADMEQQRTERNTLIIYHLQQLDDVLKGILDNK